MILYVITLVLLLIFIYVISKRFLIALPYLFLILFTPIYEILDASYFTQVLGTSNSNILRLILYGAVIILMSILGLILSKKFKSIKSKIMYILTVPLVNFVIASVISKFTFWA